MAEELEVLDVVALLDDVPGERLRRGQVGTIVEVLDQVTVLVEFSDGEGRAYAIMPVARAGLLALRYMPEAEREIGAYFRSAMRVTSAPHIHNGYYHLVD